MRKKPKLSFADVLHLAEAYCEEYRERGLCLSQAHNDILFKDYVWQYTSTLYWKGEYIKPTIDLEQLNYSFV